MDPSAATVKDVEGHHLFPKAYLATLGLSSPKKINQVANFAPTDWVTNNWISDRAPSEYWPSLLDSRKLSGRTLEKQMFWHALPVGWEKLEYDSFLTQRRVLMARVAREGFRKLSDPSYETNLELISPVEVTDDGPAVSLSDLVVAGLLRPGDTLVATDPESETIAEVTEEGLISFNEHLFDSPRRAARADGDDHSDGWEYWRLDGLGQARTLQDLVEEFVQNQMIAD